MSAGSVLSKQEGSGQDEKLGRYDDSLQTILPDLINYVNSLAHSTFCSYLYFQLTNSVLLFSSG